MVGLPSLGVTRPSISTALDAIIPRFVAGQRSQASRVSRCGATRRFGTPALNLLRSLGALRSTSTSLPRWVSYYRPRLLARETNAQLVPSTPRPRRASRRGTARPRACRRRRTSAARVQGRHVAAARADLVERHSTRARRPGAADQSFIAKPVGTAEAGRGWRVGSLHDPVMSSW